MFTYGFQPWAAFSGQQILEAIDAPNFQVWIFIKHLFVVKDINRENELKNYAKIVPGGNT